LVYPSVSIHEPVRLGVLVPSVNTMVEPDMYRMAPPGVTIHFSRLPVPSDSATVENLFHLEDHLQASLQSLAHADVRAIAFACTSGSFIGGDLRDKDLIEKMKAVVSLATTASESILSALRHLDIRNVSLVTPYPDPLNERMRSFFMSQGIHVTSLVSLQLSFSREIRRVTPEAILGLGRKAGREGAEGVVISCTDFQALPIIDVLEREIRKPVIASNQATLWRLMNLSGVKTRVEGYGCLMREGLEEEENGG
jgi:maleate isomerase